MEKVQDMLVSSHRLKIITDFGAHIVCDIPYQSY